MSAPSSLLPSDPTRWLVLDLENKDDLCVLQTCAAAWGTWFLSHTRRQSDDTLLEWVRRVPPPLDLRDWANADGLTPLMRLASMGRLSLLRVLLPCSDPRRQDWDGYTALSFALRSGHLDCVKLLMPLSPLDVRTRTGETLLMLGAQCHAGSPSCLRAILPHSDPLSTNRSQETALMCAVRRHCSRDTLALLRSFSNEQAVNDDGLTAFEIALGLAHNTHDPSFWRVVDELSDNAPLTLLHEALQQATTDECLKTIPRLRARLDRECLAQHLDPLPSRDLALPLLPPAVPDPLLPLRPTRRRL